jgi:hypothetical protein
MLKIPKFGGCFAISHKHFPLLKQTAKGRKFVESGHPGEGEKDSSAFLRRTSVFPHVRSEQMMPKKI